MRVDYWKLRAARDDYYTKAAGIRNAAPELLDDPLVLAAVLQAEMAELALGAILDNLAAGAEE